MTERKCSNCRQPGHTKATCIRAHDPQPHAPFPDAPMSDYRDSDEAVTVTGPVETITKGPWHGAHRHGRCTWCGDGYAEGDRIRSDGQGGWECGAGIEDLGVNPQIWQRPTAANVKLPAGLNRLVLSEPAPTVAPMADIFSDPAPVSGEDSFSDPAEAAPEGIVKTERLGYICKDPVLGDFRRYKTGERKKKGITRTTTFVKAASDSFAITEWNKRNVLLGAARRPDIASKAFGMDVNNDKRQLDEWVAELEDAAGGNVASSMGTDVHTWTERVDAGECTVDDVPPTYQTQVRLYVIALKKAGLHVIPELRERTTFIEEFGGVAGTFDAILYHEPSDTYVLSDTKSGKNVGKYGWTEIETQEWVYAHGYNRFGCYNWDTGEWEAPEHQVRMDYGLVIHLPFQGEYAATCRLLRTDLREGAKHAELCAQNRAAGKGKPAPFELPESAWELKFISVHTTEQAGRLWQQAKAAGVEPMELQRLVKLAQDALR